MCKVIIDAFDDEESAIAFVDWFKKNIEMIEPLLFTTKGVRTFYWDGVDTGSSSEEVKVINIVEDSVDREYEESEE